MGIVSNGYWATSEADAIEWLSPMAGLIQDLSISSDLYHWDEKFSRHAQIATQAAEHLNIPLGIISVAQPEEVDSPKASGQLPIGESAVMYRGRAAHKLAGRAAPVTWNELVECPYEDLRDPDRVHVDSFGNLHLCQGLVIGNLFENSLVDICRNYDPDSHPIAAPLLAGGPRELVLRYEIEYEAEYADACHMCDDARRKLRAQFPEVLLPDQMYLELE